MKCPHSFFVILGIISSSFIFVVSLDISSIRLRDGKSIHEGNIQVLHKGEWRSICDDRWGLRDAKVTCRQLGFDRALNATKKGYFKKYNTSSYWLDDMDCWGSEVGLHICKHRGWGDHNCLQGEEAGVICSTERDNDTITPQLHPGNDRTLSLEAVELRLVGPKEEGFISRGRLEVYYKKEWLSFCDEDWNNNNYVVACGELGFPNGQQEKRNVVSESAVPSPTWQFDVKCNGLESKLMSCRHVQLDQKKCKSRNRVWLNCKRSPFVRDGLFDLKKIQEHDVRLRSGFTYSEGRVEIKVNGNWSTICDDAWDIADANVICRQMGFGTAKEAFHNAKFGYGVGKILLDEVECTGSETDINNCSRSTKNAADCGHAEDASVRCHTANSGTPQVRLSGGPHTSVGKVEVLKNGKWYGVCGVGFKIQAAEVICRQLGLGYAKRAFSATKYGSVAAFGLGNVKCSGKELFFDDCANSRWFNVQCRYYSIASVECTESAPDVVVDVAYLAESIFLDTRYLNELMCAYEENCLSSSATYQMNWRHLFTRRLLRFSTKAWNRGTADYLPSRSRSRWDFHQCHNHYHSMERFSDYDLLDSKGRKVAEGHKASFCLEDSTCDKGVAKVYNCTDGGDQGIAVNCGDAYKSNIDCQWIDVTDVSDGNYVMRVIVNAKRDIVESDYSNNAISCKINLRRETLTSSNCQYETCEHRSYGGTANGGCCKFPFIYKGITYHTCTKVGFTKPTLWCSTTSNYDNDKKWGYC